MRSLRIWHSIQSIYKMSRTKRKPYTGSKAVDKSCRGKRGSCPTCSENRQYKNTKRKINTDNEEI